MINVTEIPRVHRVLIPCNICGMPNATEILPIVLMMNILVIPNTIVSLLLHSVPVEPFDSGRLYVLLSRLKLSAFQCPVLEVS